MPLTVNIERLFDQKYRDISVPFPVDGASSSSEVNALDYGAVGDGVTNSTSALAAWITAINASSGGALATLPAGQYVITQPLPSITASGVTVQGAGWTQTAFTKGSVISASDSWVGSAAMVTLAGEGVTLQGVMVDGGGNPPKLIAVTGGNCRIINSSTHGVGTGGVCVDAQAGSYSLWIDDCRINGINYPNTGIQIADTDAIVTHSKPCNNTHNVVLLAGADGAMLQDNHMTPGAGGQTCVYFNGNPAHISIDGNRFDNYVRSAIQISIPLDSSPNAIQITNNLFHSVVQTDQTYALIGVDTTFTSCRGLHIVGNTGYGDATHRPKYALAAQKLDGTTPITPEKIANLGCTFNSNTFWVGTSVFGSAAGNASVYKGNQYTLDGTTYQALADSASSGSPLNVLAYGAKGDGSTDDAVAIQAVITAVSATTGGAVYFPPRIYKVNTGLLVTNANTTLRGDGWDQSTTTIGSILKAGAAMTDIVKVSGERGCVDGMSFDGAGLATNCLTIDALNCQVIHSYARNPATNGIGFNTTTNATSVWWTNCRFNGANRSGCVGFYQNGTDATMTGCKAVNCMDAVQYDSGASGSIQTGCHHTPGSTIGRCAINLVGNAANVQLIGNRIDNHALGSAIQVTPSANIQGLVIDGNLFFQNVITTATFAAIGFDTTSAHIYQAVIVGNVIRSAASHVYTTLLTAQKLDGTAASNPTRVSSDGTICNANSIYAGAAFGTNSNPLVARGNVLSTDGTTYAAVTDI